MAKSRSIGSIYAELTLRDKMTVGLAKARKSLNSFAANAMKGAAVGGVAAGFAAIGVSISKAVNQGGELADMMNRTGAAGEGLVVAQRALENAGIAAGSLPVSLNKMQKALAMNADAFGQLGLSVDQLKATDPVTAFEQIGRAIASLGDPATKTKAAMDIFGRSGGELLAVFNDSGAFDLARQQVGGLGKTLAENASQLDAVGDAFGTLETKATQFGSVLAVSLLPTMTQWVDKLNQMDLSEAGDKVGTLAGKFADLGSRIAALAKYNVFFQLGKAAEFMAYDGGNLTEKERRDTINKQRAESDLLYSSSLAQTQIGSGNLASPEFQKARDEWMAAYVKSFEKTIQLWTAPDVGIPDMLARPEEAFTTDIPGFLQRREKQTRPWESSSYGVNEYQSRGLALSGGYQDKSKEGITLLGQIRDILKKAETNGELVFR